MTSLIKVNRVSKNFGSFRALYDVSLELKKGEIYGLIGRNGAGKTTLLKILTGLIYQTEGEVVLVGEKNISKALNRVGSVIETPVAINNLTAYENLKYYATVRGISNKEKVIKEVLTLVGLENTGKKHFKSFSLGMKQRLGIAIALLGRPDILILDEPVNGLDPLGIAQFRHLVSKLNEEYNMTIIISSHILSELYQVATKFGIIDNGRLIKEFTKEDFEKINKDYIVLHTNLLEDASKVLSDENIKFKVVNDVNEIHIFEKQEKLDYIVQRLVQEKISIQGIYYERENLEDYFTKLVGEEK